MEEDLGDRGGSSGLWSQEPRCHSTLRLQLRDSVFVICKMRTRARLRGPRGRGEAQPSGQGPPPPPPRAWCPSNADKGRDKPPPGGAGTKGHTRPAVNSCHGATWSSRQDSRALEPAQAGAPGAGWVGLKAPAWQHSPDPTPAHLLPAGRPLQARSPLAPPFLHL